MNKLITEGLLLLPILLFSQLAHATCTTNYQYTGSTNLAAANYSAGPDTATGTTIYRQLVPGFYASSYNCSAANPRLVFSVVGGTLVSGSTNTYLSGIPGIGIRIYPGTNDSGTPISAGGQVSVPLGSASGSATLAQISFFVTAVKIGPITAGMASSGQFPQVHWDVTDDSGTLSRLAYTNTWVANGFTVNTPTCTTPDFNFNLGSTVISNSITTSNWVNTVVTLTGCSAFYGNSSDFNSYQSIAQYSAAQTTPTAATQTGTFAKNSVTMVLSPIATPTNASQGILANQTGDGFASGVGVQMATQSGSTYTPINLANNIVFNPALGSSAVSFPLAARMIKTADVITPGAVSASLTYTITYQ
ncbi:type 1 fimbrial protein [Enterobacteriaceae bacterium 89]|nr:type 1 fimbrial protein [Enterobacteriaceae bacterium 89]